MRIKQRDMTDCGCACLAAVCAYYKLIVPVARIRQYAGADLQGTSVLGITKAANQLGMQAKGARADIKTLRKAPLPAIAHVILDGKLQHYVTLCEIGKNRLTIMDPAEGRFKKISQEQFLAIWTGVIIILAPDESFAKGRKGISTMSRFWNLAKPQGNLLLQSMAGAVLISVLGLSASIYVQKIVDHVLTEGNARLLNVLSIAMVMALVFQVITGIIKTLLTMQAGQYIDANLIMGYYRHLLHLPQRFFDTMRIGEMISRINDAVKIRAFISDVSVNLVVNTLTLAFSFLLMFLYYWKLALIMAAIVPIYIILFFFSDRINKKWQRRIMENSATLDTQLVESLQGIRTIKKLGLEDFAITKTENGFLQLLSTLYKESSYQLYMISSAEFITRLFTIIILWMGSYAVIGRELSPGELLSFYSLINYFTGPAINLVTANKHIREALIAADRLFEIVDLEREDKNDSGTIMVKELTGDIQFRNVCFSYGHKDNLFQGLNMVIRNGSVTGITGGSGCGKSTIVGLLQKIYPLSGGSITIDGIDISYINIRYLRNCISIAPQQTDLFQGSIMENIAPGEPEPDLQRILDITERLGLRSFIEKLPQRFNTQLEEQGSNFSGGQRQRISIARAIYHNPSILIMDEATAGLDALAEYQTLETLKWLRGMGKTIIVISHKKSTLSCCDTIIKLEEGRVTEEVLPYPADTDGNIFEKY